MKLFKGSLTEQQTKKKSLFRSNKWVALILLGIFVLVLFLNSYLNYESGVAINEDATSLTEKFYLSGPDPYYNMRIVYETIKTGHSPYVRTDEEDPLLNYPLGRFGARPPLFNMITIALGKALTPFLGEADALGYCMQFLPAIYGALLIFPVYLIGATLFGRKSGLLAAFFVAIIPIHISSGHGSAYSLYDHDSFNLLLFSITFFFVVKSLRAKDFRPSLIYAGLAGTSMAAISMSWAAGRFIYAAIAVYAIVQMIADTITKKSVIPTVRTTVTALVIALLLSSPYLYINGFIMNIELILVLIVALFSAISIYLQHKNIPWVLSLPAIFSIGGVLALFLYLIRDSATGVLGQLANFSNILFGDPVYGTKVSETIAEAGTFGFSRNVMSLGPVIYLLGLAGFIFLIYKYYKHKRRSYLFLATMFVIQLWLSSTAGRFINDLVSLMALFAGWLTWLIIEKINFSEMVKTIRGIGGGWHGLKKGIKLRHVAGIIFIVFFILFPNGWMTFDAAVPSNLKQDFDMEGGAFGLSLHTEEYWIDALSWFNQQDNEFLPKDRPGFISWWDYGFYESAAGGHPTVADNFQDGIPPASNFHIAKDEKEAVSVWIIRLLEGFLDNNEGEFSPEVNQILQKYLGNQTILLTNILQNPSEYSRSYNRLVAPEYNNTKYRVTAGTAIYHDGVEILNNTLNEEQITWFYHDIQNVTGYSIRYYGVEGYDINIFNVFTFLADKGTFGYATDEDDYFKLLYVDDYGQEYTPKEIMNMTSEERQAIGNINAKVERKDAFFDSMVYKAYLGEVVSKEQFEQYFTTYQYSGYVSFMVQPTAYLRHFVPKYISPITEEKPFYFVRGSLCIGCPAVVISKYYEGAYINGTITSNGEPVQAVVSILDDYMGYPHDAVYTDNNGNFNLIAPGGNISLRISPATGNTYTEIETITFNSTTNPSYAPISEEEAMRHSGTTYQRFLTINLPRGISSGTVFWDKDGDGKFNSTNDTVLSDARVTLGSISTNTNSMGYYSFNNLIPGEYTLNVTKNGYATKTSSVVIKPEETTTTNVSTTLSTVKVNGAVWFDANSNNRHDSNETMANVPLNFTVIEPLDKNSKNATLKSNATGLYQTLLVPATYQVSVNYIATVANTTYLYTFSSPLQIKIGDTPKTLNIQLARNQQ